MPFVGRLLNEESITTKDTLRLSAGQAPVHEENPERSQTRGASRYEFFGWQGGQGSRQTIGDFRDGSQFVCQLRLQRADTMTPMVIAHVGAGRVQPGFAAETKNILQRNHRQIRGRTLRRADQSQFGPSSHGPIKPTTARRSFSFKLDHHPTVVSLSCVPV